MRILSLLIPLVSLSLGAVAAQPGNPPQSNEAAAIAVCEDFFDAQVLYVRHDHDNDAVREYAKLFYSWRAEGDPLSSPRLPTTSRNPLWTRIAKARHGGFFSRLFRITTPHHGYYFRILTQQGRHAPGGVDDFKAYQHMVGGFAILAWPARWGVTGTRTFMLGPEGRVFAQDLGPKTEARAGEIAEFNPGPSWRVIGRAGRAPLEFLR